MEKGAGGRGRREQGLEGEGTFYQGVSMTGTPDINRIATWLRVAGFTAESKGHVSIKATWEVTLKGPNHGSGAGHSHSGSSSPGRQAGLCSDSNWECCPIL